MSDKLKKAIRYLTDSDYRFLIAARAGKRNDVSDEEYLRRLFRAKVGTEPDFKNPKTFNEKLNWLKLHDRNPLYGLLADKYEVKQYVADRIGAQYVIPTLGVWDRFDEIPFDSLPDAFVLKCTHDSGGLVICRDKNSLNRETARAKIEKSLVNNYYYLGREWCYKDIKPRIIAEQYMEDPVTKELRDYKFFCFDGVVKALFIATDRQSKSSTTFDFFDADFNHLDVRQGHPNAKVVPEKPKCFDEMMRLSQVLSEGFPHVRVDFYEVDGKVYFGELTFYHFDGLMPFDPPEWDLTFGKWLRLPGKQSD